MITRLPGPRRPEPTGLRARRVVEWAEVTYYVFWLAFSASTLVVALIHLGPAAVQLLGGK